MRDEDKSREQILQELADLRQQLAAHENEPAETAAGDAATRRRAEEMLRATIDHSAAFIYLKDLAGRFLLVNKQFELAFHKRESALLGKTDFEIHATGEQARAARANDLRVVEMRGPVEFEEVVQLDDGPHTFDSVKFPVRDSNGVIYATGGISTDVTERQRTEKALRESEDLYRALFESIDEGFCIIEMLFDAKGKPADYRFLQINPAFQKQTGLYQAEGRLMRELAPDHEAHWFEIYGKVALTGEPVRFVNEAKALNRWYDVFAFRLGGQESRKVAILFNDITERKRVEEEREELLRAIVDNSSTFVYVKDLDGRFLLVNRQFEAAFHKSQSELLGKTDFDIHATAEQARAVWANDLRVIETGGPIKSEEVAQLDDGPHDFISVKFPLRDSKGAIYAIGGISTDITERKRAEEERERLLAELEATVEAAAAGVVAYDRSGRIARMNASAARIMGYTESDMTLPMAELFARLRFEAEDGRALSLDEFPPARALRGERVGSVAMALHKVSDGGDEKVWIYDGAGPIRLPSGEIVGAVVSFVDISGHKRLEEALRESEERFRAMVDSIPQLAWMAHADGFIFWYNRRWYEYTGTSPEQMAGWGWQSVHDPAMLPKVLERWKTSIATGEPFDMEFPLLGADGRFRWFLTRISPLKDERGRVVRWFGTNTDVDEKREAEAERERLLEEVEARASELAFERDRLRTVLSSIADAVFVCDAAGTIVQSNAAALALLGAPSAAVGRNLADYMRALRLQYPDGRSVPMDELAITRALSGVTERGREEVGVHPTTRQRIDLFISAAPLRDADGRVVGAVEVAADITQMRELADAVQQRAAELQAVLDNMVDAVFVCTPDGRITLSNAAANRLFGLPNITAIKNLPAEAPARFNLRHPDGRPLEPDEMATTRALAGETVANAEQVLFSPQFDQDRYVRVSASPIRDAEGKVAGAVVVARDVTALTELDRLKDEFLAVAAHELKTPVTIMKGYAQALERASVDLPPPARRMIDAIDHGADRIDRIVKDLLDITRLQAGQLELADERVDLARLAEDIVDRFALTTTSRHHPRVVQADPAVVRGDRSRIGEVLADLLDNAVRYSPAGGDVDVAVRVEGDRAVVSVRDRGVGIPREKQSRIFERFYRAHTRTQYDYGGMGVGLYIAREVIARHGGQTWFESEEGKGSTFYFSLPLTGG